MQRTKSSVIGQQSSVILSSRHRSWPYAMPISPSCGEIRFGVQGLRTFNSLSSSDLFSLESLSPSNSCVRTIKVWCVSSSSHTEVTWWVNPENTDTMMVIAPPLMIPQYRLRRELNQHLQARHGRSPEVVRQMLEGYPKVPVGPAVLSGFPCDRKGIACIQVPIPEETFSTTTVWGGVCDAVCAFWLVLPCLE